jgi:Tol biopolymer transport system component
MAAVPRRRSRLVLLALALCVALLALVPAAIAATADGTIVFQGNRGGPPAVFTVKPNGSDLTRLGSGLQPAISDNGKKIVFVRSSTSGAELWVLDVASGNVSQITDDAKTNAEPAISPDGSTVAFIGSQRGDDPEPDHLFVIDADGTHERQLFRGQNFVDREPNFSPDGKRIVFVRGPGETQLMTITVGGDDLTPVTERGKPFSSPEWPTYSPDGKRILFNAFSGGHKLYTIGTDGKGLDQLSKGDEDFVEAAYSPDGSSIVFRRHKELFTMNADGSGVEQLSNAPDGGSNIHPSWGR